MSYLVSFAPWILFWVLSSNNRFIEALIAACVSLVIINSREIIQRKLKVLNIGSFAFFSITLVVVLLTKPDWLEHWMGALSNAALTAIAGISLIIGKPFTIQYAMEMTPKEYWDTPGFKRVNKVITMVWTASFFIQTISSAMYIHWRDNEFWLVWVIPLSCFTICVKFTAWYPQLFKPKEAEQTS